MDIVDRREISFGGRAIGAALTVVPMTATSLGLPAATPDTVRFLPAEQRVELLYAAGAGLADFWLSGEALGALLVAFCCRRGIALPHRAEKSIHVGSDAATLSFVLRITSGVPALATRPVPRRNHG